MKNIMPPINTPDNAFHDGNPATGEQGTIVPGLWLNNIQGATRNTQQELISVLTAAGMEIDENVNNQLSLAILKLILDKTPSVPIASLLAKGIVQLSNSITSTSEVLAATPKAVKAANDAAVQKSANLSDLANVQAALTNLTLTGIGIGLPSMTGIDNFDFQTFVFTSGANYIASSTNWLNVPTEISYPVGLAISIKVDYVTGTQIGLEIKPSTVSSSNFRAWYVRLGGYPGSRTYTAREIQTSANPVPISGGGTGAITASAALANIGGVGLSQLTGIVGTSRNAKMSVVTASATSTFTADELIVQTALGGLQYKLSSFSKTINLATTGAGGMDTGTVPATGYVALYAIYNPTTQVSALLAVNTTSVLAPEVCGGVMPSGYTASALVSVWRIVASKFIPGEQVNRSISIQSTTAFTITASTPATTIASISSIVPPNTKRISGIVNILIATTGGGNYTEFNLFSSASSTGRQSAKYGAPSIGDMNCNYSVAVNGQNVYYSALSASGSLTASAYISEYEF